MIGILVLCGSAIIDIEFLLTRSKLPKYRQIKIQHNNENTVSTLLCKNFLGMVSIILFVAFQPVQWHGTSII